MKLKDNIDNIKMLSAVLGPDNPFFFCALNLHSLPEEVKGKETTKTWGQHHPKREKYSPSFLLE